MLAGTSHQDSYNTSLKWLNCEKLNGDCTPTPFYNQATGQVEQWERNYFTLEENGGLKPGEIRNINNTLSLTTGIKGSFGQDDQWAAAVEKEGQNAPAPLPLAIALGHRSYTKAA